MANIDVVKSIDGDWEAVYLDGVVVEQNHSVQWDYLIQKHLVGKTIDSITVYECDLSELGWAYGRLDEFDPGQLARI